MDESKFVPLEREMGQLLMRLRGDRSQEEVSRAVGVRRETIKQWENAERHIKAVDLVKLSAYYNVSVDYLLGISQQPFVSEDIQTAQKTLGLSPDAINKILYLREYLPQILEILDKILANGKCIETLAMVSGFRNSAAYNLELLQEKLQALKRKDAELAKYQKIFGVLEAKNQAEFLLYRAAKELEALLKETVFEDVFGTIEQIETEKADELEANDGETE